MLQSLSLMFLKEQVHLGIVVKKKNLDQLLVDHYPKFQWEVVHLCHLAHCFQLNRCLQKIHYLPVQIFYGINHFEIVIQLEVVIHHCQVNDSHQILCLDWSHICLNQCFIVCICRVTPVAIMFSKP